MKRDYYNILGISKSASQDEIKRAYRKLAMQHHPDRGGGDGGKFKEINEAYQVLSDPQKRQQYDTFGSAGFSSTGAGGFGESRSGSYGFDFGDLGGRGFEYSFGGLGDIFGDLFSQAFSTVQAEVEVTPAQAVLGDHLEINVGADKIDFEIPPGVQDGTQFRFRGKGRETRRGQKGDLIIEVRIKMPKKLSREQKELWEKLKESESIKKSWWNR